jgi:alcohol dehydrogenase class IV
MVLGKLSAFEHFVVAGEPTIEDVEAGLAVAKEGGCDCVVVRIRSFPLQ